MSGSTYSHRLRVRSCGLLLEKGKLLLIELYSPVTNQWTWLPPGGEVEFGETLEEALIREFKEETGLQVIVRERICINEVIKPPVHAIEFYFLVERESGELELGSDPELGRNDQILRDIGFFSEKEIETMRTAPDFLTEFDFG